jgi:hypothetical protein
MLGCLLVTFNFTDSILSGKHHFEVRGGGHDPKLVEDRPPYNGFVCRRTVYQQEFDHDGHLLRN